MAGGGPLMSYAQFEWISKADKLVMAGIRDYFNTVDDRMHHSLVDAKANLRGWNWYTNHLNPQQNIY